MHSNKLVFDLMLLRQYLYELPTFEPHPDLKSHVKCYWTLEVAANSDNIVSIIEIPVSDFARAIQFYKTIYGNDLL